MSTKLEDKVSVIMGVYNPPDLKMIDVSVKSILEQTYDNIELVICDNASDAGVVQHLEKISKLDNRIKLLYNKRNMGLAYSLNRCIQCADGKYIARQDVDDVSEKNRLEKQVSFLKKHLEYAFVGSNISLFDNSGIYGEFLFPEKPQKQDFLFTSPFCHGSIVFRRQELNSVSNYRVSKETRRCEDYDLFMRMYIKGYVAYNIQEKLYQFREDYDSARRRKFKYRIDDFEVRKLYFKKLGIGSVRYFFILKPLLVGLIPICILDLIKKFYYKHKHMRKNKM